MERRNFSASAAWSISALDRSAFAASGAMINSRIEAIRQSSSLAISKSREQNAKSSWCIWCTD